MRLRRALRPTLDPDTPLTWRPVRIGNTGRFTAMVVCGAGHAGRVTPSVVCTHDGCGWHEHVELEGWGPG